MFYEQKTFYTTYKTFYREKPLKFREIVFEMQVEEVRKRVCRQKTVKVVFYIRKPIRGSSYKVFFGEQVFETPPIGRGASKVIVCIEKYSIKIYTLNFC